MIYSFITEPSKLIAITILFGFKFLPTRIFLNSVVTVYINFVDLISIYSPDEDGEEEDTRESVMKHVQSLMDNLEKKRETDKQMVEEFRTKMHSMVWRLYIFNIVNQDAKFYKCVFYKSYVKICLYLCCFIVK